MSYNIAHPSIYLLHRLSSLLPNVTFPAIPPSAPSFLLPPLSFLSFSRSLSLSHAHLPAPSPSSSRRMTTREYDFAPPNIENVPEDRPTYIYIYISIVIRAYRFLEEILEASTPLSLSLHHSPLRVFGKGRIKKLV